MNCKRCAKYKDRTSKYDDEYGWVFDTKEQRDGYDMLLLSFNKDCKKLHPNYKYKKLKLKSEKSN